MIKYLYSNALKIWFLGSMKAALFFLVLLWSCSNLEESFEKKILKENEVPEKIYRLHNEEFFKEMAFVLKQRELYPWEEHTSASLRKITKEYFRCKGSEANPPRLLEWGKKEEIRDCGGVNKHGLLYKDDQEFVYPSLIDLLNMIQKRSGERVIITTGHRCPVHNRYADSSKEALYSKHQIGAEVDFYVEKYEENPLEVIKWIMEYYQSDSNPEYARFLVCQKNAEGLKRSGWYNKEIIIRIHEKDEGRDFDNRHPYPYITIEIRYDRISGEHVVYDYNKAYNGYIRY